MTSPNLPPPSGERLKATGLEPIMPRMGMVAKVQALFWSWAILEVAVILAINNPTSSWSQALLRMLVSRDDLCVSDSVPGIRITAQFILGWILSLSGCLIRCLCYRTLGPLFTFELSVRKEHALITSGPYSIVRHPSYMGVLCALVGVTMSHMGSGSWVGECTKFGDIGWILGWMWIARGVLSMTGMVLRMEKEDEMLRKEFGSEWEEWRKNVPWRVIPGVY